jgi:hypothetical protein
VAIWVEKRNKSERALLRARFASAAVRNEIPEQKGGNDGVIINDKNAAEGSPLSKAGGGGGCALPVQVGVCCAHGASTIWASRDEIPLHWVRKKKYPLPMIFCVLK